MRPRRRARWLRFFALCVAAGLVAVACGDDDSDDAATGEEVEADAAADEESTDEESTDEEMTDEESTDEEMTEDPFCTAGPAVDAAMAVEEPDPETVEAVLSAAEQAAPESIAESVSTAVATVREIFATGNFDLFEDEAFTAAVDAITEYYVSDCGFEELPITAVEYEYGDVPTTVSAGTTVISLTNGGTEVHELGLVRINDDVDLTVEELLMLPEEEAATMITDAGAAFAFPGDSDQITVALEPGRYAFACFIPVGTTPENIAEIEAAFESGGELAPPHFTEGMFAEFEVT